MKRYKHTLSHYNLTTAEMGMLHPIGLIEVLPGDTIQHSTSALIRLSPLNTPVMHPTTARIHHFFVPNRITFPGWEDFITGGTDGLGEGTSLPTFNVGDPVAIPRTISGAFGVPPIEGLTINALPVQAYNAIFNEFYRDQDLVAEVAMNHDPIKRISWAKDYFTTARPWTQRGPDITIPISGIVDAFGTGPPVFNPLGTSGDTHNLRMTTSDALAQWTTTPADTQAADWNNPKVAIDLADSAGANVNDFRNAFALQRYQEARARYGARYVEYLRYLGIKPSDARLQRPEYLGGGSAQINFSEVLQTAPDESGVEGGVADMWGHGIAGMRGNSYRKFFEEHGYIITLLSVRPKSIYTNGLERTWNRRSKEDYFQKELMQIGQQEVASKEVFADGTGGDEDIFGYQDRYSEYKYQPSQVMGEFTDTLKTWHMARDFASRPALNSTFTNCNPNKQIYQVTDAAVDSLWCTINHSIVMRRMVAKSGTSRIL